MGPDSPASDEIRRFEEQYRRQPESLVFARLADAYRKAGQPEKALAVLEDGLIRHPDYPSGHIVRARALRDMGRMDETLDSFRRVLELDGANLVAIRELAGLADERGDTGEARHWYERLGQIDPADLEVRQRLRDLDSAAAETLEVESVESVESTEVEPVEWESDRAESGESSDEAEGPSAWWDDSAVNAPAHDVESAADTQHESRRPEDDAVEAILNGDVPQTVRAEDTWWYEEAPQGEEPEPSKDADLLTRTMADLYAEQGLHREAAAIYEELLKDAPGDPELLTRLEASREDIREASWGPVAGEAAPPEEAGDAVDEIALYDVPSEQAAEQATEDEPIPLGRPVGTPWPEELRRLLRLGEARSGALPDRDIADPVLEAVAAGEAGVTDEVDDEVAGDEADDEANPPAPEPEDTGPSRFARDWISRLEGDG
jgi:tetratricopeptide (TPR) repeat protein